MIIPHLKSHACAVSLSLLFYTYFVFTILTTKEAPGEIVDPEASVGDAEDEQLEVEEEEEEEEEENEEGEQRFYFQFKKRILLSILFQAGEKTTVIFAILNLVFTITNSHKKYA